MDRFEFIALTPAASLDPSIAVAACRAGGLGVLDLEYAADPGRAQEAVHTLARLSRAGCGIRLDPFAPETGRAVLHALPESVRTIIAAGPTLRELAQDLQALRLRGVRLLVEVLDGEAARQAEAGGADGLLAKGMEAGGWIGEETTFILLQRLLTSTRLPVWAQGGIGLHTAAACAAGGAAGVVLDSQLALTRECALPAPAKAAIQRMDGSETTCLGEELDAPFRAYLRPGLPVLADLRQEAEALREDPRPPEERRAAWRARVRQRVGWGDSGAELWPLAQDAAFAADLGRRFVTVGGILAALRRAIRSHIETAKRLRPLDEGAPLARSHGTRYPIVQGPMTRVSDVPAFAAEVAEAGGLPFLALALLRGPQVRPLLEETRRQLADRPWGVGILGFVPLELRQEQLEAIRAVRPPFALIAGGRPDQARALEQDGIPTYLHVPSPGLLRLFLGNGARRFVFEGRECGGHVGPRSSFVLWDTMIDVLLDALPAGEGAAGCHVLFAAGIHDALSACMVAAMAAPLAERGVKIGALLGTAYLFTHEAVRSGAIQPAFQDEAVKCARTVLLETGPGHATRCAVTAFARQFEDERRRQLAAGRPPEEAREALEELNLGRLRIAAKGVARAAQAAGEGAPRLVELDEVEQRRQGMYMIGQVAAVRQRLCSIQALHHDVAVAGSARLAEAAAPSREVEVTPPARPCNIAIVGMACLMPKAPGLKAFWANILNKVDAITEIPADRFDWRQYYDPTPGTRDRIYSKWGGFLDPVPFDPARYGMPPASLPSIEPTQLLLLEVVRAAVEDAGYTRREFARERTGVIVGVGGGIADLGQRYCIRSGLPMLIPEAPPEAWDRLPEWTEDSFAGIILNVTAGRVANRFDLGGVNYAVDAACASSLAALYAGVRELEAGTADSMIIAGADTVQNPFGYLCFGSARALSPRGRCRTFDESADGIVIGEGIAVVVLKRLADAERDGDRIYAVIKAVAGSSDGRDRSMTAPRPEGQMLALRRAYASAGFSPATVGLIEAHGTGTVAGDRAEIDALTRAFGDAARRRQWCAVGSVKSMIGHTKCAAGLAGLLKVAKALHHKILPPTLGVERPNAKARFAEGPFYVNAEARPWLQAADGHPRRAGVSAFGFGGTNFHAVLEEYTDAVPSLSTAPGLAEWPAELFLFTGRTRQDILAALDAFAGGLRDGSPGPLRHQAAAAWQAAHEARRALEGPGLTLALLATSQEDLRDKLAGARERLAEGVADLADPRGVYFSESPLAREGRVAFLFPGQGSQHPDMLRELAMQFEEVRACFEAAGRVLRDRLPEPLGAYVFPPPRFSPEEERAREEALKQTNVAQPSLGAADLAVLRLLGALGVAPQAAAGHSYGEYVALCAAGVLGEERLYALSEVRGRVIMEGTGEEPGTMAAVQAGRDEVAAACEGTPGVWIANLNAPRQTIISGTRAGVEAGRERLEAAGLRTRPIPVACAFHSPLMAAASRRLAEELAQIPLAAPRLPVFSNTLAAPYAADPAAVAALLCEHMVRPVRFVEELEAMYGAGCRIFVEVGPRNVLTALAQQVLEGRPALAVAADVPGRSGLVQLLHLLGQLAAHGVAVSLERLFAGRLDDSDAAPPPALTPTTWMVSGGQARPLQEKGGSRMAHPHPAPQPTPPPPRVEPADGPARSSEPGAAHPAQTAPPGAPPAEPQLPAVVGPAWSPAGSSGGGDVAPPEVLLQFQQVMTRFLETQRNVMLAYLGSGEAGGSNGGRNGDLQAIVTAPLEREAGPGRPTDRRRHPRLRTSLPVRLLDGPAAGQVGTSVDISPLGLKVRLETALPDGTRVTLHLALPDGPPALTLGSSLLRSDHDGHVFSIASLSRAELARVQGTIQGPPLPPAAPVIEVPVQAAGPAPAEPHAPAPGAVRHEPALDRDALRAILLRVVSDRTGYPADMLALDANLEADLGIDSIKRVEILGALQQGLPAGAAERVRGVLETLTRAKTLGDILATVTPLLDDGTAAPAAPAPGEPAAAGGSPSAPPEAGSATVPRFVLEAVERPPGQPGAPRIPDGVVVITEDASGLAALAAAQLASQGARVVRVAVGEPFAELEPGRYRALLHDPEQAARFVAHVRQAHGPIGGILHLAPLDSPTPFEELDLAGWRGRLAHDVKSLFCLGRAAGPDLQAERAAFVLAATGQGGAFGCQDLPSAHFPGHGGVAGLIKTLAVEWPSIFCLVVDVDPAEAPGTICSRVLGELCLQDERIEIGWAGDRRLGLSLRPAPHAEPHGHVEGLTQESVLLVTGGARGITGEVTEELARRYRPRLILVGRSPLPAGEESPETAGLKAPRELKGALIAALSAAGRTPLPAEVERAYAQLLRDREVRRRMAAMREAGATVVYRQVDMRDAAALRDLVQELYRTFGRIDGVIHGAGVIEDKLLQEKDPGSFDRVFDTKVDSAFVLARTLRLDALRFLVFFSSVAGRFGNRGQSDYVAANEVLNKLARHLDLGSAGRVVALNWGPWSGSGMVSEAVADQFAARGVVLVPPAAGRRMLDLELAAGRRGEPEVVLGAGPWAAAAVSGPAPAQALPLVGEVRLGAGGAVEYVRELDVRRDLYLLDHQLDEKPVLPAAMAAEMMAEVAAKGWPEWEVVGLRGFRLLKGIVLSNGSQAVHVLARPQTHAPDDRGELQVSVEIQEPGGRPAYRGTVILAGRLPDPPRCQLPPASDFRAYPLAAGDAYRERLFHGPRFHCIADPLGIGSRGILAAVQASQPARWLADAHSDQWLIDPAVLDAGPQLAILWARETRGMTALPTGFRGLQRFARLRGTERLTAYFAVAPQQPDHTVVADVHFVDESQRLVLFLEGLECPCSQALNRLALQRGEERP